MAFCLRSFVETLDQVLNPLKHYKKWVLDHDHRPQIQSLFENATFLQNFLDHSSPLIQERIASLEDQIMEAAQEAADTLESYITAQILLNPKDQSFTIFPPDLGEVIRVFEDAKQDVIKIEWLSRQPSYNNVAPPVSPTRYPDNQGSQKLADFIKSNNHDDENWVLLRGYVFGEESCPRELEEIGKRIALDCGDLPIALKVVGGLLAHSQKSNDFWEYVARNVSSSKADDQFSGIFSLAYTHLPHYLKPCFLYMSVFPEDWEIPASKIIKLWVAEGFLLPVPNKSLEEAAEIHLNSLVNRNLILVHRRSWNGKAKSYGINYILRGLCLRKVQEKKFLCVKDLNSDIIQEETLCPYRVSVYSSYDEDAELYYGSLKHTSTSLARSFILSGYDRSKGRVSRLCSESSLLRVLDVKWLKCQDVFLHLVNLRYLCIFSLSITNDFCVLQNLQILRAGNVESLAILEHLPHLRQLHFRSLEDKNYSLEISPHPNLQHLTEVPLNSLTYLAGKIPNLKKLRIDTKGSSYDAAVDLACFQKLESLKFCVNYKSFYSLSSNITIPMSLKKLEFGQCKISQTFNAIVIPPELQVLILTLCEFEDGTWEPSEAQFRQLQYLEISFSNLNWLATELHFPVLRHLVLKSCKRLTEIPSNIGGIETLETIEVDICKASVFNSANAILKKQLEFGNTHLRVQLGRTTEDIENERAASQCEVFISKVKNHELTLVGYGFSRRTIFPRSVRILKLEDCNVSQTILTAMGVLPELQVLQLENCYFEDSTWEPSVGQFRQLHYLKISNAKNLVKWCATENNYPVLRHLVIQYCDLSEIPIGIGRIETLELIDVEECKTSLDDSARIILFEQRKLGNTLFQLRFLCESENEMDYTPAEPISGIRSTTNNYSYGPVITNSNHKVGGGVLLPMDSVVKVFCVHSAPNFLSPWQRKQEVCTTSSGFVIKGKWVLTTARSVRYYTQVRVKKRGSDTKYVATVLAIAPECNIALLTVGDDEFWEEVSPVEFGDLPAIQDAVTVVGYPGSGESISVTKGVVSRIEVLPYIYGSDEILFLQIDAAINPGNSGGPAFNDDGVCVGIAFHSGKVCDAENVGFAIPVSVIMHFIQDFDINGTYTGFPAIGVEWQTMENPELRLSMGMKPEQKGILVKRINPTSPEALVLKPSDIILSFDGVDIANDGTVPFRYGERLPVNYLVLQKYVGDSVEIKVLRNSKTLNFKITLGSQKKLIPTYINNRPPPYYIIAGFVLTPLSVQYLRYEFVNKSEVPVKLMDKYLHGMPRSLDEEIVIVSQVLAADVNIGYQHVCNSQVLAFNGQPIKNLKTLASMIEGCTTKYLKFELEYEQIVVLQTESAKAATVDILSTYCIPSAMSGDL